jgi:recombination DNA repair RAD52 pathway protein
VLLLRIYTTRRDAAVWQVIAEANRIFGFDGWQRLTIAVRCVSQAERPSGREQKPGWGVTYTARVRVTVTAGGLPPLVRECSGAGHGIDVDLGQAHESALKEGGDRRHEAGAHDLREPVWTRPL